MCLHPSSSSERDSTEVPRRLRGTLDTGMFATVAIDGDDEERAARGTSEELADCRAAHAVVPRRCAHPHAIA